LTTKENLNNINISLQENTWKLIHGDITLFRALDIIKSERLKIKTQNLRKLIANDQYEKYTSHKKNLPCVTFAATFDKRRLKENIITYNKVMVLDIDDLTSASLLAVKNKLATDPFVLSFWESPSQKGIKGIVKLNFDFDIIDIDASHKSAFKKLKTYFQDKYDIVLDNSGSDTTRLCFLSHDPNIVIKTEFKTFTISQTDVVVVSKTREQKIKEKIVHKSKRDILFNPFGKNNPNERYYISVITKFLEKRNHSITRSYDEWLKVALAISNSFTYDVGERYFLRISAIDKNKFDEVQTKNFLKDVYYQKSKKITFGTIIHFANKYGYSIKYKRKVGSEAE